SFRVGRQANALATIMEILLINLLLVFFITGVMLSFNVETISTEGVFLFAFSIGTAGTIGASIVLVTAQIAPTSSGAAGLAFGITGFLYIVRASTDVANVRSEEHTSELQSRFDLVCRLLLEKKKTIHIL